MDSRLFVIAYVTSGATVFISSLLISLYRKEQTIRIFSYSFAYLTISALLLSVQTAGSMAFAMFTGNIFFIISNIMLYCGIRSSFESQVIWPKRFWLYIIAGILFTVYFGMIHYNAYLKALALTGTLISLYFDFYLYLRPVFAKVSGAMKSALCMSLVFTPASNLIKTVLIIREDAESASESAVVASDGLVSIFCFMTFMITLVLWFTTGVVLEDSNQLYRMAEKNRLLASMAENDNLTGLYNRNKLEQRLPNILKMADRLKTPISFIILDIDHFKIVNDQYGHAAGDRILIRLANILRENVRETDMTFRWGGEEFLILAIGTPLNGAAVLAEHLRGLIESETFDMAEHITASFGIAEHSFQASHEQWFERADTALYKSKELGRNRVTCWGEFTPDHQSIGSAQV